MREVGCRISAAEFSMNLTVVISGKSYGVDLSRPCDLAIPLDFSGPQPRFFGAPDAASKPFQNNDFIGATSRSGSCNVSEIHLVPHCNGTHTESVGHIVEGAIPVTEALTQSLLPATLITVTPVPAGETGESYQPVPGNSDSVITETLLSAAMSGASDGEIGALIIRTRPNDGSKRARDYGDGPVPPYFTADAMGYLSGRGVTHLLVDMPSIDRMNDGGYLTNHHIFWNVSAGSHELTRGSRTDRTVTEMVFVDDSIADGLYLLNLQLPAFVSDAAPSRPVLYPLVETR